MSDKALFETNLSQFELAHRGKVRDVYRCGERRLLIVASDRVSAFDRVMKSPIPGKGVILSELAAFWFQKTADIVPNHWIAGPRDNWRLFDAADELPPEVAKRAMYVKRRTRIEMECIVRGYLAGSAWRDYSRDGRLNGVKLPDNLKENSKFSAPMFTPSTKASGGAHDEPLTYEDGRRLIGKQIYAKLERLSLELFDAASSYLLQRGLILVDTKFEFGLDDGGDIALIDEIFTPDSSRFWELSNWRAGEKLEPLDKEYLRQWLLQTNQNGVKDGLALPSEVISKTLKRYTNLYERVLGKEFHA